MKPIKYAVISAIILLMAVFLSSEARSAKEGNPYDLKIKTMHSEPNGEAKIVYQIPIDVKMLDVSEDADWYKTRIKFYVGPIEFSYTGWINIPVGSILAERSEKSKLANLK